MRQKLKRLRPFVRWHPGLRMRFTLWVTVLLLVSGTMLGVAINLTANYVFPKVVTGPVIPLWSDRPLELLEVPPKPLAPSESAPPVTVIASSSQDVAEQRGLGRFRLISAIVITGVVATGSAGAYPLSGRLLRPVTSLSSTALAIHGGNLAVRASLDGPEDEVKALGRSFNRMLDRLQEASEREKQFVSDAAHELRTPLAILRANLDSLISDTAILREDPQNGLAALDRGVSRLENMVGSLLYLAADRPLDMHDIVLGPLLEEVQLDCQPLAEQHNVTLELRGDLELEVCGDPALLRHVFRNLVENGIRYNVSGGRVDIEVRRDAHYMVVEVRDTGMGIPPEERPHVFKRFYRGRRAGTRYGSGSGLGLAIAARVVERHGGNIDMTSHVGSGSAFTVRLPCSPEDNTEV